MISAWNGSEESHSARDSPTVLVHTLEGTVCFYMDLHKVNSVSTFDAYSIPRIDKFQDWLVLHLHFGHLADSLILSDLQKSFGVSIKTT